MKGDYQVVIQHSKRYIAVIISMVMLISVFSSPSLSIITRADSDPTTYELGMTDVTEPKTGNILIEVPGASRKQDIEAAINRINEIREEACREGLAKPNDDNGEQLSEKLTEADYKTVEYSLGLECIALIRAAEAGLLMGHNRPNSRGNKASDIKAINGSTVWLENIAYFEDSDNTLLSAVNAWYEEKDNYINNITADKDPQGIGYGHYQTMINPDITCVGMGLFSNPEVSYPEIITGEFGHAKGAGDMSLSLGVNRKYTQLVEIDNSRISKLSISGEGIFILGETDKLNAVVSTSLDSNYSAVVNKGVTWSSDDSSIVSVDESTGEVTAVSPGQTKITAKIADKYIAKKDVMVLGEGISVSEVVQPEDIVVENRVIPDLPENVKVNLSNGDSINIRVNWEDYDIKELNTTFTSNDFVIYGDAFGYEIRQKVHVNEVSNIRGYADVDPLVTDSGKEPLYPKAYIKIEETMYPDLEVRWDQASKEYYKTREGGNFTLTGVTEYAFRMESGRDERIPVSATLIVNPATVVSVELETEEITTVSGVKPNYPKVKVTWSNGDVSYEDVTWTETEDFVNGYNAPDGGSYTISGKFYDYINKKYIDTELTANVVVNAKVLESLKWKEISSEETNPSGTVFYDSYDWSRISGTLIARYNDNTEEVLDINDAKLSVSGYDETSKESSQTVTFSYSYGKSTVTAEMVLTLYLPKELDITPPDKTEYIEGQSLVRDGLEVITVYDDGKRVNPNESEINYIIEGYNANKVGEQVITVKQDGIEGSFTVNVLPKLATKLQVSEIPLQKVSTELNLEGVQATISYNDGDSKTAALSSLIKEGSVRIDGYLKDKVGTQAVVIFYSEKYSGGTQSNTIKVGTSITVKEKFVSSISVEELPDKCKYVQGNKLDLAGAKVHVYYDDSTKDVLDITEEMISGYDKDSVGTQTITVTLEGKTDTFEVTVIKKEAVKRYFTVPVVKEYVEGQGFNYKGMVLHTEYNDGSITDIDIDKSSADIMLIASDGKSDTIEDDGLKCLTAGEYTLMVVDDNIVKSDSDEDIIISVRKLQNGVVASVDMEGISGLSSDSSDSSIKAALSGSEITVPCEGGSVSCEIKLDSISEISDAKESEVPDFCKVTGSDVTYKKVTIKVGEIDGKPVNTFAYIPVAKKATVTPQPTPTSKATPTPVKGGDNQPDTKATPIPTVAPTKNPDAYTHETPAPGSTFSVGGASYKIQKNGSAAYSGPVDKGTASVSVPDAITVGGKSYPITAVGADAFKGCTKMKTVKLGKNVTTIGARAFKGCTKLTKVTMGAGITTIGDSAFYKCTSLTSIVIPKKVTKIGKKSFYGCKKLKTITIKTTKLKKKTIGSKAFKGVYKKAKFKCPKSKLKNYKKWIKKAGAPKKAKYKK